MSHLAGELAVIVESVWTQPFWDGLREHRLQVPRCANCSANRMPPGPICWNCSGEDVEWVVASGTGSVHTFTVTRRAFHRSLEAWVPYVVAVVQLDGTNGSRLVSNIVGIDPGEVQIGMEVEVLWDQVDDVVLPRFAPRATGR